jgi:peptide/nickel transport system ATP-binding protein
MIATQPVSRGLIAPDDVLAVENLQVSFHSDRGDVKAVRGVTFGLKPGERLGLVGESGCGKTTTALAIMRLIRPPGRIVGGKVLLRGDHGEVDLASLSDERMRQMRLSEVALIPQGSMNSLNPVKRIGDHFADSIEAHERRISDSEIRERTHEVLRMVGLRDSVAKLYPHELSGGMKQRVCIALSITLSPKVIIADEPTSALDVVVQRHVMETLGAVQQRLNSAVILVGHDMGLLAQFVDRLGVMYAGKLVELAPIRDLFEHPLHPYTNALITSLPTLEQRGVFRGVPGLPPSLRNPPEGCLFAPRCPRVMERCTVDTPELQEVRPGHWVACHLY